MPPKKKSTPARGRSSSASPAKTSRRQPKPLAKSGDGRRTTTKPPRYRPPPNVTKQIAILQSSTDNLIPQAPFARLVREITMDITSCGDIRYQKAALRALHEAAETYIVGVFEDSYLCALHAKRVTLMARDLRLAYRIRGDSTRFTT